MTAPADELRAPRGPARLALLLAVAALVASCSGGGGDDGAAAVDRGPNRGALPTLAGGIELTPVDPARVLVGEGLAYGAPLPSEQAAADAFAEDPEVAAALARRVYSTADGRHVADALVLSLDGTEIFDEGVLDGFARGVVAALGTDAIDDVPVAGRTVLRSRAPGGTVVGFLEGDLLVVLRGPSDQDIGNVVTLELAAYAAGAPAPGGPVTPLVPLPADAAFVAVPTVTFQPIPPPEEEPPPTPPGLPGATGVEGRYGVVAGERRTTVWAFTLDAGTYPNAEALEPALAALASGRAGGAPAEAVEVLDRVVQRATGADGAPSARAFRHQGLAILVEGQDPDQVDAVVSAWIAALSAP